MLSIKNTSLIFSIILLLSFIVNEAHGQMAGGSTTTTAGTAAVSSSGASTALAPTVSPFSGAVATSYSIDVPAGRGMATPQLAITYNSGGVNGNCGAGWNLEIPYIEMTDSRKGVAQFNANDKYVLHFNGGATELVSIGGSPAEYRTEAESFMRIIRHDISVGNSWWELIDISGMIYRFGFNGTNSQPIQYLWFIDKATDIQGNFIEYSYSYSATYSTLSQRFSIIGQTIQWGSNGLYKVQIDYEETRPDKLSSYRHVIRRENKAGRISTITVSHLNEVLWKYVLAYRESAATHRTLLASIRKQTKDARDFETPTTFDYQDKVSGWSAATTPEFQGVATNANPPSFVHNIRESGSSTSSQSWDNLHSYDMGTRMIDVNGDALPDMVTSMAGGEHSVYINKGKNTNGNVVWEKASWQPPIDFVRTTYIDSESDGPREVKISIDQGVRFGDINGDGLTDIVQIYQNEKCSPPQRRIFIANKISGWVEENLSQWTLPPNYFVNSNGLPEMAIAFISEYPININNNNFIEGWAQIDVGLQMFDVNGDGYDDLVLSYAGLGAAQKIYLNTYSSGIKGWSSAGTSEWTIPKPFVKLQSSGSVCSVAGGGIAAGMIDMGVRVGDVNGDGLPDLIQSLSYRNSSTNYSEKGIYLNNGRGWNLTSESGWFPNEIDFIFASSGEFNSGEYQSYSGDVQVIDVNGDGLSDIVESNENGREVTISNGSKWILQPEVWDPPILFGTRTTNSNGSTNSSRPILIDEGVRYADVDGDGLLDLIQLIELENNNNYILNSAPRAIYFNTKTAFQGDGLPDLLYQIKSPTGAVTKIVYTPSTAYRGTISAQNIMPTIIQTAKSMVMDDGMGRALSTAYSYAGAKFDAIEREFMGFREVTVKTQDVISSATLGSTVTTYHQTIDKAGKPEKVATYNAENKQIDQVDFSYAADGAAPYFTPLTSQTKTYFNLQNYDGNVTQTTLSESHLLNGLPTKAAEVNVKTDKGLRNRIAETRYAFEHYPDAGIRQALINARRLAQPYETIVSDFDPQTSTSTIISQKRVVLNANTLLTDAEEVWDAERNLWIRGSTVISRDGYGTVLETEDIDGIRTVAKLGHQSRVPIATISDATNAETFVEDFDDGRVDDNEPVNWSGAGGQWRTDQTATLRQVDKTIESICRVTQPISFPQDFIAEFDVRILRANNEDGSYWAAFRFKKANYADAWESGNILFLRKNGVVELWSPTAQLAVGNIGGSTSEWRHLRILGVGNNIKVFADGVLVLDRNDVPVASGGYFDFLTYQTESEFDNLRIYPAKAYCSSQSYDAKTLLPKRGTDALGISTYTTYDALYRPIYTRNHEGLIVAEQEAVLSSDLNGGSFSATNPNRAMSVAYPTGQTSPALNNLNPVLNAGFEAGTENGLPKFWQVPINLTVSVAAGDVHSGTSAMRITTNGANGYVHGLFYDPDYLKPNTAYRISFWAKRTDGPNTINVYAYLMRDDEVGTAEVFTNPPAFMPVSGSGWQFYQATLTTKADPLWNAYQSMIRIDVHQNGQQSFLLIDDVRVERVNTGMPPDASVSTTYTDGLGRTLQTHQRDGDYDQVSKVEYDGFGRAIKQYVPNRIYNPAHSYLTTFTVSGDYGSRPYSETMYRAEPQSRASQQIPAGATDSREHSYSDYGVSALSGGYFETAPYSYSEGRNTVSTDGKMSVSRSYVDRWGRTVKTVSGFGSLNEISSSTLYDISDRPVKMRDPRGMESVMTYNFLGQLIAKTTPDAGTSRYIYDKAGRLRFSQDAEQAAKSPMQQFSYFSYDMMGRMTEEGYGYIVSGDWASNRAGLQATADADRVWPAPLVNNWRKRSFYDDIGTQPFSKGSLIKMQTNNDDDDAVEVEETFSYDKYGRTTAKTIWVYDYDGGTPHTTRYSYDLAGRVTKITYPSSSGISPQSQPEENEAVTGETTEAAIPPPVQMAFEVTYGYDVLGRLVQVGKPGNASYFSEYGYRSDGAMVSETLRRGISIVASRLFNYNTRGWLIQNQYENYFTQNLSYFSGGYGGLGYFNGNIAATSFTYGFSGAPSAYTYQFKFDVLGRLKVADNNAGASGDLGVGSGGVTELPPVEESTDGEGGTGGGTVEGLEVPPTPPVISYVYPNPTAWGELITIDGNYFSKIFESNVIKFIGSSGTVYTTTAYAVTQTQGNYGTQLTVFVPVMPLDAYDVTVTVGTLVSNRYGSIEVYPATPVISAVSPTTAVAGGQVSVFGDYFLGCKATIGGLSAPVLTVNAAGTSALLGVPENLPAGTHTVRMVQPAIPGLYEDKWSGSNVSLTVQYGNELSYDANGNFLSVKKGTASPTLYGYIGGTNKVSSVSDAGGYTHNANGAILTSPKVSLPIQYDPHTRMTAEMHNDMGSGYETLNEMLYNASGERVLKVSHEKLFKSPWYISKTLYLHGLSDYPLVERKTDEFYGGVQSETKYVYGASGLICAIDETGVEKYILKDHLGSTRLVVNASGGVVANYDYSAFGSVWRQSIGEWERQYRYTGQERDSELSLYNYRARMYDEDLMRFYDTDPADQQFSPYAYSGNNPVMFTDPTGQLFGIDDILIATAFVSFYSGLNSGVTAGQRGGNFFSGFAQGAATGAVYAGLSSIPGVGQYIGAALALQGIASSENIGEGIFRAAAFAIPTALRYLPTPGNSETILFGSDASEVDEPILLASADRYLGGVAPRKKPYTHPEIVKEDYRLPMPPLIIPQLFIPPLAPGALVPLPSSLILPSSYRSLTPQTDAINDDGLGGFDLLLGSVFGVTARLPLRLRPTHVYQIWDGVDNTVYKYGITVAGSYAANGLPTRLAGQLSRLNLLDPGRFTGRVLTTTSRPDALRIENYLTTLYRWNAGTGRIPSGMFRPNGTMWIP